MNRKSNALEILSGFRSTSLKVPCVTERGLFFGFPARTLAHDPRRAFSLIELLVVIAIIAILAALATPALNSILQAGRITQAASQISATFTLAAQKAASENRPVTLRFIGESNGEYRRMQIVEILPDGTARALDRVITLPEGMALATNPAVSSFFSLPEKTAAATDPNVPGLGTSYRYREFQFRPDGRLGLDVSAKWFVTALLGPPKGDPTSSTLPVDFVMIQVDPVNGSSTLYRP